MDSYFFAQLNDMGAEVTGEDKRVIVTTQLNARFRELAKVFTTRTPDLEYHQLSADLLLGDRNHQALNLYEMTLPATTVNANYSIVSRPDSRIQKEGSRRTPSRGFGRNQRPSFSSQNQKVAMTTHKTLVSTAMKRDI